MTAPAKRVPPKIIVLTVLLCCAVIGVSVTYALIETTNALLSSKRAELIGRLPAMLTVQTSDTRYATASASLVSDRSLASSLPSPTSLLDAVRLIRQTPAFVASPLDESKVRDWLTSLESQVEIPPVPPTVTYVATSQPPYALGSGQHGESLDVSATTSRLLSLDLTATSSATLVMQQTGTILTPDAQIQAEKRLERFLAAKIPLRAGAFETTLRPQELLPMLALPTGFSTRNVEDYVEAISKDFETEPVEPKLVIENNQVVEFVAPKDGLGLPPAASARTIIAALESYEAGTAVEEIKLEITTLPPKTALKDLNTLGIEERIGFGESKYAHSIANRVHNVALTTSKMHAKLIAPGEEFSFNKYLGDVSAATGFKQAYVIRQGRTELGDGGGVCQVSSTLFRTVLDAGLPITERKGHSYRVSYYEQNSMPGFDATVYSPKPDFRFTNDTGNYILINAVADSKNTYMYIEFYGKSDGRIAEVTNYKKSGSIPPPEPLYQDDPSLKPGQVKQIEYATAGLKTSFDYIVKYPNGEVKEKTFSTNYVPWRAVYLRGPAQ